LLPIAPAGLGLREAGLVGLGALVGVPAAAALAWSLTISFGTLVVAAAGGLIEARGASNHVLRLASRWRGMSARAQGASLDRKSVVEGKRVARGGGRRREDIRTGE